MLESLEHLGLLSDEAKILLHHEERADEVAFQIASIAVRDEWQLVILGGFPPLGLVVVAASATALARSDERLDENGVVLAARRGVMMRLQRRTIGVARRRRRR